MKIKEFIKYKGITTERVETFHKRNGHDSIDLHELLEEYEALKTVIPFKESDRAKQLAVLLYCKFKIILQPAIKRRYTANSVIKFEMKDKQENVYYFNGLVQDFVAGSALILLNNNTFSLEDF